MFDILFGTFKNPEDFAEANGFYDGASLRMKDILLGRDITRPPLGKLNNIFLSAGLFPADKLH